MTEQQFIEAVRYTNAQLTAGEEEIALRDINERHQLPAFIKFKIADLMDEWCNDHDINPDEWREIGDEEDVFLTDDTFYLITQEWNSGEFISPNFPKYHINAYRSTYEDCRNNEEWMEKASPYDYCTSDWYDTKKEWQDKIDWWISKGVEVRVHETTNNYKE